MADVVKALNLKEAWGIYALYITAVGAGAVTPALAAFGAAFPDANPVTISLIQSLPSLTTIFGTLFSGVVAGKHLSFRKSGILALSLYLVLGCLPTFWNDSLTSILVARAFVGFAMGMLSPLGVSVFLRVFKNKEERTKYIGRGGAVDNFGCVLLTLLGGFLCAIDWRLTFLAYTVSGISLVIFIVCFKEPPTLQEEAYATGVEEEKPHIPRAAWFYVFLFFAAQVACSPTMMNFSTLMANNIPGEAATSVAGLAGILLSVFVASGVFSSIFLDALVKIFGRFTGACSLVVALCANLIIANADSVAMFAVGITIYGLSWCLVTPLINLECGNVTNQAGLVMVTSFAMTAMHLGNFAASYYMGFIYSYIGVNPRMLLTIDAVVFAVLAAIWAIFNMRNKAMKKSIALSDTD